MFLSTNNKPVLVSLLLLSAIGAAHANTIVIAPGKYNGVEAGANTVVPFGPGNPYFGAQHSMRFQQIYDSSLFNGPININQILFRYDGENASGFSLSSPIPDIQFNLSTTPSSVTGLSNTFASNVGSDDQQVFHGTLQFSSQNVGSPRPFDLLVTLQNPFLYDPSKGNLLLDIRNISGWVSDGNNIIPAIDGLNYTFSCCGINPQPADSGPRVVRMVSSNSSVNDSSGAINDGGAVTEFVSFAPEPGSIVLSLTGLAALLLVRNRKA